MIQLELLGFAEVVSVCVKTLDPVLEICLYGYECVNKCVSFVDDIFIFKAVTFLFVCII